MAEDLTTLPVEDLKERARAGDKPALQALRDQGFFDQKPKEHPGYVVSHAQKRLWVLDRMSGGKSSAYNVAGALLLNGPLNRLAFEKALIEIVNRHESLRTTFHDVDGQPRQRIHPNGSFALEFADFRNHEDPLDEARNRAQAHASRPFDLETGPLFRASLLQVDGPDEAVPQAPESPTQHVFLYCLHHIVCDEWSLGVLVDELAALYRAFINESPSPLQPLPLQYKDFAARQSQQLGGKEDRHRNYWVQKLSGAGEPLDLATDFHRPAVQSFSGESQSIRFGPETSEALHNLSRSVGGSLYVTLHSLVKALFHRYTGQESITLGCPVAGRERYDLENQIGFYVNTLALNDLVLPADTFSQLLGKVQKTVADGFEHQSYPFENILDDLKVSRDGSHTPLFDAMVVLSDEAQGPAELDGVQVTDLETDFVQARFDFVFGFTDTSDGIHLNLIYNRDLYEHDRIAFLLRHFRTLVLAVLQDPDQPIGQLDLLDADERHTLASFSPPSTPYPAGRTIDDVFASWAQEAPTSPALIGSSTLTYGELNEKADRWANALRNSFSITAGTPVGVSLKERELIIPALLAILKAGGIYVPIDPTLPPERMRFILEDSACQVVLTDSSETPISTLPVARPERLDRHACAEPLSSVVDSREPAYIIYTSGSTGRPKGVIVEHEGFVNMIHSQIASFGVDPADRILQFASCSFDASLYEIFLALHAGASLVTLHEEMVADPDRLLAHMHDTQVSVAVMPPSYLRVLGLDRLEQLKTLVTAGEQAINEGGLFGRKGGQYINAYGPTEFSVCATTFKVPEGFPPNRSLPIGKPNPNAEVLVLEPHGDRMQPIGVVGELCLSGINLARGYVNLPDRTAESFPRHPYRKDQRLYRTGDLARWLPDGTIECLGRLDDQVKVNGYRIELDEITHQLSLEETVAEAGIAVLTRESSGGEITELVAYVVPSPGNVISSSRLRAHLARVLPAYMLPAHIVEMDTLPRTVSGKLDRSLLPAPETDTSSGETAFAEPKGALEKQIADIWQEILGVERIGVEDDFFHAGGNSLKAIAFAGRVRAELLLELDIREVFQCPTIRELSGILSVREKQDRQNIDPIPDSDHYAVSNAQRRLWILDRMDVNRAAYNISSITRLKGNLDVSDLEHAFAQLVQRHESLRTRFTEVAEEPRQIVDDTISGSFRYEDLRTRKDPQHQAQELAIAETSNAFDLERGPLFRSTLFRIAPDEHILVLCMHHIISDGWSLDVMVDELLQFYASGSEDRNDTPLPLNIQYRDYAKWQNDRIAGEDAEEDRQYWLNQLGSDLPVLDLPTDAQRPSVQSFKGAAYNVDLAPEVSAGIRELARRHEASLFSVCTALVNILLHRYTEADDIVIGAPVSGRNHPDLESQVGFFVNMLALRNPISGTDSAAEVIERVKGTIEDALSHSAYPFDLLVEELDLARDMGRNPLFDVVVSFQNATPSREAIPGLHTEEVPYPPGISKFDLTFFFDEHDDGSIGLAIEYATDLFRPNRISRMADHFRALITSIARTPESGIGTHELADPDETHQLVKTFAENPSVYPNESTIVELFESEARRVPDRMAIEGENDQITYAQLNSLANQLAREIRNRIDLQPEESVGILMGRSVWAAIGALAILKAGGSYLPLDASYPVDRLTFILSETGSRLVLTDSKHIETLRSASPVLETIDVCSIKATPNQTIPAPPFIGSARSLAYTVYTSGSTGQPKGVQVENRSVVRLVRDTDYVDLNEDTRILQTGSLAFDASTFEIWGVLLNGGCVCFPGEEVLLEPALLKKAIRELQATTMFITTGLFNQNVDSDQNVFEGLSQLLTGGEKVSTRHVNRVRELNPNLRLIHCYGPTENTTFTTCHQVKQVYNDDVPLGRPIANTTVYVLDKNQLPCPIGLPGEICTGGDGVARGYLNRSDLTEEAFIPNPFVDGDTIYRTGDIGFWNEDGTLAFLGRVDDQVKIRGFRVEPGDIEHHMREHEAVNGSCVQPRRTTAGTLELVGYYTSSSEIDRGDLRSFLEKRLPGYAIPSHFVHLERFPVNRNGKIDRAALPEVLIESLGQYEAPRTLEEQTISDIISSVLGIERVGLTDNFLEAGGDSIRAIQVVSRLKQQGLSLLVKDLFQTQSVEELAQRVEVLDIRKERDHITGEVPLTPIQEWFFQKHTEDSHHFNQSVILKASQAINETGIKSVLESLVQHHDMLRATFTQSPGGWTQDVKPWTDISVQSLDLREHGEPDSALEAYAAEIQGSFELDKGPLIKAVIYRMPDGDRLFIVIHHLLVDGVSWRILLEDLETGYKQFLDGSPIELAGHSDSFLAWSRALRTFAQSEQLAQEIGYWSTPATCSDIPSDFDRVDIENLYGETKTEGISFGEEETAALLTHPQRAYRADVDAVLLSALSKTLGRWHEGDATSILIESHGREPLGEAVDLTRTVGWFTSMYPIILRSTESDIRQTIRRTKEDLRRIPRHGLTYGVGRYLSNNPEAIALEPKLVFNYLGQLDTSSGQDGDSASMFEFAEESVGPVFGDRVQRQADLELTGIVTSGRLHVSLTYHPGLHKEETISAILEDYREEILSHVEHCRAVKPAEKTPTDFTSCDLPLDTYDSFLAETRWSAEDIDDIYPLSPMQAGLLYQHALESEATAYHLQMSFTVRGDLNKECFRTAWDDVIDRHAILRTAFVEDGPDGPLQIVLKNRPGEFRFEDISSDPAEEQERCVTEFRSGDLKRGFDLERDPLIRFAVFRLGEDRYQIVWSYHHIILDGWSLGNLYAEFGTFYNARVTEANAELPPVRPYGRYIDWLQQFDSEQALNFWKDRLQGIDQVTSIPALHRTRPNQARVTEEVTLQLTEQQTQAISALARRTGVTVSTLLQTAWAIMLSRYNDTDDTVFGAVVSGRPSELGHIEEMVGLFINAIPQRIRVDEDRTFADLLRDVQNQVVEAEPYHYFPLAEMQTLTPLSSGIFDHLFIFENYPTDRVISETHASGDAALAVEDLRSHDVSHYPFELVVVPGETIEFRLTFDNQVYGKTQISQVRDHLLKILTQIIDAPDTTIGHIDILPVGEKQNLDRFQVTKPEQRVDDAVLALIDKWVQRDPDGSAQDTRVYVTDSRRRVVPIGVVGEICLGATGPQARHVDGDEVDETHFVNSPHIDEDYLYCSRALGRWLPDGSLEYAGRIEDRLHIEGYSVYLIEIESVLREHPLVGDVAVWMRELEGTTERELTAYIVGMASEADLTKLLEEHLPDWSIPRRYVYIPEIPLTEGGQIDYLALPEPEAHKDKQEPENESSADPDYPLEDRIREIWMSVLKIGSLDRNDDFFDLGGHSLKATQVVSRILRDVGIKIKLQNFFKHSTVAELARHIRKIEQPVERDEPEPAPVIPVGGTTEARIDPAPHRDTYALSHAQKRLWLLHQLGDAVSHNVPQAFLVSGDLDTDTLNESFTQILDRHEILRTAFVEVHGEPRQQIMPGIPFEIEQIDLTDQRDPEAVARELGHKEATLPFDLSLPPLIRVKLLSLAENKSVLLINMHHIVGDGWSDTVLFREMVEIYDAKRIGKPSPLLPLRIQYKDFSEWQNAQDFDKEERFWLTKLVDAPEEIRLPFDYHPGEDREFEAAVETYHLRGDVLDALRTLAQAKETTLANLLLALFKLFLFRLTKQEDMCVGVNVANRNHTDLENLIGFFVNLLPIRTRLSTDMSFDTLLDSVTGAAVEAYDNQDYPFDLMVQKLNPNRTAGGLPLVNVLFAFQNFVDIHVEITENGASSTGDSGLQIETFPLSFKTSKFDFTLLAVDDEDSLDLHVEYDAALFKQETIKSYLNTIGQFAATVARSHPLAQSGVAQTG